MAASTIPTILFRLDAVYAVCTFVPIIFASIAVGMFLTTPEQKSHFEFVPTISEMVMYPPQSRVFLVGMVLSSVTMMFYYFIREHLFTIYVHKSNDKSSSTLFRTLQKISAVISVVSLTVVAACPVNKLWWPHMISAFAFFISTWIYFVSSDVVLALTRGYKSVLSVSLNVASMALMMTCFATRSPWSPYNKVAFQISSCCQYLSAAILFSRFVLSLRESPKHGIRVSQRD